MTRFVQVGAGVLRAGSPDPSCANRTAVYTDVPPVIQSDDFFKEVQSDFSFTVNYLDSNLTFHEGKNGDMSYWG